MRRYLKAIQAFTYTKPLKFLKGIFSQKNLNRVIELLLDPNQSDELKAFSAALGIFLAVMPIWGFQTVAAISLAVIFKLNKPLVFLFSHVSFPPVFPLVVLLSFKTGGLWLDKPAANITFNLAHLGNNLRQYLYGSITLAIAAGIITGLLTFASLKIGKSIKQYRITARLKKAA
ncbi:MAG TPA: DUF2062 domain-containing protein [Mucilaginibacter sp.]|jgi:uncharacterized protein (DUF2062 family)|nr:DUF2062 domain-containing protein [Mucilaginibacter sp.]